MKFHAPDIAGDAVASAMSLLQTTDALLIDLRNSEGGSPEMVTHLVSYFLPAGDPILHSTVENRFLGITRQYWTTSHLPGPRYARHIDAATDWEGVGITPDVAVAEADAPKAAHLLALRGLLEKAAGAEARQSLQEAITELERSAR